jgi:hypothetical protein
MTNESPPERPEQHQPGSSPRDEVRTSKTQSRESAANRDTADGAPPEENSGDDINTHGSER